MRNVGCRFWLAFLRPLLKLMPVRLKLTSLIASIKLIKLTRRRASAGKLNALESLEVGDAVVAKCEMRLSVLIDKLAQIGGTDRFDRWDRWDRDRVQTKRTQNANEVISPKSLCQPISRVVRGLSWQWIALAADPV